MLRRKAYAYLLSWKKTKKRECLLVKGARQIIMWLSDANLVHVCRNVSEARLPLLGYEKENEFKLYVNDSGLLMAMYGMETKKAVLTGKILGNVKGGIYENLISEILVKESWRGI